MGEHEQQWQAAMAAAESAAAAVEIAKAESEVARAKAARVESVVGTARANVEAAELALEKARRALGQTTISSPFDGVVVRRNSSPGEFPRPGEPSGKRPLPPTSGRTRWGW
jgi:multidrug resistance efflux pump